MSFKVQTDYISAMQMDLLHNLGKMCYFFLLWCVVIYFINNDMKQGCALTVPGRLRRLTFGLERLKKKRSYPSGRLDFGLCENPKRNQ